MCYDKIYFKRRRGDKEILQEMQWKSFTDSNAKGRDECLNKLLSGEYTQAVVILPRYMIEGEDLESSKE